MPVSRQTDFETWIRSRETPRPYFLRNHRFEKKQDGTVSIDGGKFELEEAEDIGVMLLSANPVSGLTAQVAIWERNGSLVKGVLVVAIILLVIVVLFLRR